MKFHTFLLFDNTFPLVKFVWEYLKVKEKEIRYFEENLSWLSYDILNKKILYSFWSIEFSYRWNDRIYPFWKY